MNKYKNHTLGEVVKAFHEDAQRLNHIIIGAEASLKEHLIANEFKELDESITWANVYINDFECKEVGVSDVERRVYLDAIRAAHSSIHSIKKAAEALKESVNTTLDLSAKAEVALAVSKHMFKGVK
jgi:hypothetical protein